MKKLNRRQAIRAKCLDCSGGSRSDCKNCRFNDCSLYPFRMGIGKQDSRARNKAIRAYCLWCVNGRRGEVNLCPSRNCPLHTYRNTPVNGKTRHIERLSGGKISAEGESIGAA